MKKFMFGGASIVIGAIVTTPAVGMPFGTKPPTASLLPECATATGATVEGEWTSPGCPANSNGFYARRIAFQKLTQPIKLTLGTAQETFDYVGYVTQRDQSLMGDNVPQGSVAYYLNHVSSSNGIETYDGYAHRIYADPVSGLDSPEWGVVTVTVNNGVYSEVMADPELEDECSAELTFVGSLNWNMNYKTLGAHDLFAQPWFSALANNANYPECAGREVEFRALSCDASFVYDYPNANFKKMGPIPTGDYGIIGIFASLDPLLESVEFVEGDIPVYGNLVSTDSLGVYEWYDFLVNWASSGNGQRNATWWDSGMAEVVTNNGASTYSDAVSDTCGMDMIP